jgi:hypothetical protein
MLPTTMRGMGASAFTTGVGTGLAFIMSLPLAPDRALVRHTSHVATHLLGHLGGYTTLVELGARTMRRTGGLLGMCPEGLHCVFHVELLRAVPI